MRILKLLYFLGTCLTALSACNLSYVDLNSLLDIYNAANGPDWVWDTNPNVGIPWNFTEAFLNASTPCSNSLSSSWQGVVCDFNCSQTCNEMCHVTSLALPSHHLVGTISPALGNLNSLSALDFSNNTLSGNDFGVIGSLSKLEILLLAKNPFFGSLPTSLFSATSLQKLNIS